jgi:hypothetical protein
VAKSCETALPETGPSAKKRTYPGFGDGTRGVSSLLRDLRSATASPKRKFCDCRTHEHFDCNEKNHKQQIREIQTPECKCDDTAWQQAKTRERSRMRFCEDANATPHEYSDNGTNHVSSKSRPRLRPLSREVVD